ncbi:MAG: hypothetical protein JWR44_748 [Hymenobacter sp.]|nr:hypothetical protein [Hymenobacter sp.]
MCSKASSTFIRLVLTGLLLAAIPSQRLFAQATAPGFRVVSYKTEAKPGMDILLEQSVLGPDGAVKRLITALPRGFTLVAVAQSGTRNLYLLRQVRGDSAMLLLTDSVGQTLRQPRQYLPMIGGEAKKLVAPRLYGLPGGKGFVLTYPSGKSARPALQVRGFSPALSGLWQQQFDPTCITAVEQIAANDTHVWLVLKEYLALALRPRVLSFRLETGEMTCNQSLAPNDVLDAATVMPAGLLVLGTSDRRSSYVAPVNQRNATGSRRDFALLLSPTGQRSFGVGLVWPPPGRPAHYRWQSACLLPDGGYQLIGETFRNAANAGVIALGVLGAGMLGTGGFGILPLGG